MGEHCKGLGRWLDLEDCCPFLPFLLRFPPMFRVLCCENGDGGWGIRKGVWPPDTSWWASAAAPWALTSWPLPPSPCFYSGKLAPLPLRTTPQVRRVEGIRTPDHDYPRWSVGFCFWDTWPRLPAMAGWCLLLRHLGTQSPKRSLMYIVNWAQPAENWVFANSVETSRHNYQTIVVLK